MASPPSPPLSRSSTCWDLTGPQQLAGQRQKMSDSPSISSPVSLPGLYPDSILQVGQAAYTATFRRATRKVRTHVALACSNCRNKHLRCDSARPCQQCVHSTRESTCVDVEHRKRGCRSLKPEDPSTRSSFEQSSSSVPAPPQVYPPRSSQTTLGTQKQPSSLTVMDHGPILSRGICDSGRCMHPGAPSIDSQPTLASSSIGTMRAMTPIDRSSYQTQTLRAQQPYYMQYAMCYGTVGDEMCYGTAGYDMYQQPQAPARNYSCISQQQYKAPAQQTYTYASIQRPSSVPLIPGEGPVALYGSSSLQLPPIRPAPQGQNVEPPIAQPPRHVLPHRQYYNGEQCSEQVSSERPDAKRSPMGIRGFLDPRND